MKSYYGSEKTDNARQILVLDASFVAKWILPGEPWEHQALKLKDKLVKGEIEVHEPMLLAYELANLLLKAVKRKRIRLEDAASALELLEKLGLKLHETSLKEAAYLLKKAKTLNLTAYDVAYIQLAEKLKAILVSADQELCLKASNTVITKHLKFLN